MFHIFQVLGTNDDSWEGIDLDEKVVKFWKDVSGSIFLAYTEN